LIGLVWGGLVWATEPALRGWMTPVLLGMLMAIPLTTLTSRRSAGEKARKARLFLTPEETEPSANIRALRGALAEASRHSAAENVNMKISQAVVDPYINALHVSLLETGQADPATQSAIQRLSKGQAAVKSLRQKALKEGVESLTAKEKLYLLSDRESVQLLHRDFWAAPQKELGAQWQRFLQRP
jgi:membrane glycosyltransferase